jgi:hypothetical protein
MPAEYQGRSPNLVARRFSELSSSGKLLVSTMRRVQFGRFEGLRISNGEPIWDPLPRVVRVTKIGSEEEPEAADEGDWVLKGAVRDLLKEFAKVQTGTFERITFHRGLPCVVEIAIGPTALPPVTGTDRGDR